MVITGQRVLSVISKACVDNHADAVDQLLMIDLFIFMNIKSYSAILLVGITFCS